MSSYQVEVEKKDKQTWEKIHEKEREMNRDFLKSDERHAIREKENKTIDCVTINEKMQLKTDCKFI